MTLCWGPQLCALFGLVAATALQLDRAHAADTETPRIVMAPRDKRVLQNGAAHFFCQASGRPAPTITWEKADGKPIKARAKNYEIFKKPYVSVLKVKAAKARRDNQTYTCVASNALGEARGSGTLFVIPIVNNERPYGYPEIVTSPKLRSVEKDRQVVLQCEAKGDPKPNIMWLKDNLPVDTTDPRISIQESGSLSIMNSKESDEATYECMAENQHGVAYSYRAMIYIKVRRIAPKFTRVPEGPQEVQPGQDLNLTCVAVGSPMPYVKWRQGALDLTDEDNIPQGRNILELKEQMESKNYTCEASSDLGNIEHNVQVIVTAPGSAPRNIYARAASATTVIVHWDEPSLPNGQIKGYKVFYTAKPEQPIFFWQDQEVKNNNKMTTIVDLEPNKMYTITMCAFSAVGQGPMSTPIQVLTTQGVPYQPVNLVTEAKGPNKILVKWDAPQESEKILSYELYYNDSHFRRNGKVSINPPQTNYMLINLTPDTTYNIQVSAKSDRGEGPRSAMVQENTPPFNRQTALGMFRSWLLRMRNLLRYLCLGDQD